MTHHFKNYVIRRNGARIQRIENSVGAAFAALESYAAQGIDAEEQAAWTTVHDAIQTYRGHLDRARALAADGARRAHR